MNQPFHFFHFHSLPLNCAALAAAVALILHAPARADELTPFVPMPSQSDFGGTGLMQMPSARMNKEGEFSINYFDTDQYRRYSLSLQLFPWLEATVRYVDVRTVLYSNRPEFSGDQTLKDKGIDAKFRLLKERQWLPELSAGVRDFGGTGLFASEFVAASKRLGPLDFTLGMGWGYLGARGNISNPFCEVADKYCSRPEENHDKVGSFEIQRMFKGPAALFGGVEYQTPWQPLRLKLEYDSNDYVDDATLGKFEEAGTLEVDAPINVGAVYRVFDWLDVHAGLERGNTMNLGVTMRTNFNELKPSWNDLPHPEYQPDNQPDILSEYGQADWGRLQGDLARNAGYGNAAIVRQDNTLIVTAEQSKYRDRAEAHARAGMLFANQVPADVEQVRLVETKKNLPLTEQQFDMAALRLAADNSYIGASFNDAMTRAEPGDYADATDVAAVDSRYRFGISPVLQQSFGGPESFYIYQIGLLGDLEVNLADHWLASTAAYINLADNYDKIDENYRGRVQVLPPVRTLVRKYIKDSPVRMQNLQLTWMDRLAPNWYAQAYGGYLELMYAGAGGEVLYRPAETNWALGANLNWVKQRDFDSQFGMLDYAVTTGHLGAYYELPWLDDTLLQLQTGQYLAGDKGMTFELSHKFDSGVVAGAFATLTNVSSEDYGEGSFTKGFYISIPFDLLTVRPSTTSSTISWIPLTRDGGQMLGRRYGLYGLTDARAPFFGL
ncbi:YjbH domain-containing protein [Oceanisphaera sp.]|uniref:YjbH domain-containing protein n=1 Tax=Oceanisphaera sp. TaxID=1929979 RepID=UPI003A9221F7